MAAQQKTRTEQRQYLRSAFKTYVRWEYGNYNLAKAFLKQPDANLSAIVNAWVEYKKSPSYEDRLQESQNKERATRDAGTLAMDAVLEARARRAEYTNAIRYASGRLTRRPPTAETTAMYRSGELRRRANDATRRSGYGALRDDQDRIVQILTPTAFEGFM